MVDLSYLNGYHYYFITKSPAFQLGIFLVLTILRNGVMVTFPSNSKGTMQVKISIIQELPQGIYSAYRLRPYNDPIRFQTKDRV
jgi:hypothetical protein